MSGHEILIAVMAVFALPLDQVSTICTAILAVNGMMVLLSVCKPFDFFRRIVWFTMAGALVFAFFFLGQLFQLQTVDASSRLVMVVLLCLTPVVYILNHRLFRIAEHLLLKRPKV